MIVTTPFYDLTIPVLKNFLGALTGILGKAEAHCAARKIDPDALLRARLYPDMLPFTGQVQIACDHAKGMAARLAGVPVPSVPDEEKIFADLHARVKKTLDFIATLKPEQFADAAERPVHLKVGGRELNFTGAQYLMGFAMPNFHFHHTTAYAILRHNGVEIGKRDYFGAA